MKLSFFVLALSLVNNAAYAEAPQLKNCLNDGLSQLKNKRSIVAAIVSKNGSEILTYNRGVAGQMFEIGSITKTFTGNLLAQNIINKKMNLTDQLPTKYQKGLPVTYEHIVTHTSGIDDDLFFSVFKVVDPLFPYRNFSKEQYKSIYSKIELKTQPGSKWQYSNSATSLLGMILEEQESSSYEQLVKNKIFLPLNMNNTYFAVPKIKDLLLFPNGIIRKEDGEIIKIPKWNMHETAYSAAGGIRSDINDMIKYTRANLFPDTSSDLGKSLKLMQKPLYQLNEDLWIGINWLIKPSKKLLFHDGQTFGFNSILAINQETGLGVIALTDTNELMNDGQFNNAFTTTVLECVEAR